MKDNLLLKVGKIAVPVITLATSLFAGYISGKELDNKITNKVAEALANKK